jgi:dihydroxyacetone kinase
MIEKSATYSPKQARKVIKSTTNGKIGFIICPSYKEIQLNQGTKGAATEESKSYQIFN